MACHTQACRCGHNTCKMEVSCYSFLSCKKLHSTVKLLGDGGAITCSVVSIVTWLSRVPTASKLVRQSHGKKKVALILTGAVCLLCNKI